MFDYGNTLLERGGYANLTAEERASVDIEAMVELRRIRSCLMAETDKYAVSDFPMSDASRASMVVYRQALRELPNTQSPMFEDDGGLVLQNVTYPSHELITSEIMGKYMPFQIANIPE